MSAKPFKGRKGRLEIVTTVRGEDGTDQTVVAEQANEIAKTLTQPDETPEPVSQPVKKVKPVPVPPVAVPVAVAAAKPKKLPSTSKAQRATTPAPPPPPSRRRG